MVCGSLPTRATVGSGGRCLFFSPQNKQFWLKRTPVNVGPLKQGERLAVGHTGGVFGTVSYFHYAPGFGSFPGCLTVSLPCPEQFFCPRMANCWKATAIPNRPPGLGPWSAGSSFSQFPTPTLPDTVSKHAAMWCRGAYCIENPTGGPKKLGTLAPQNRPLVACAFPQNRPEWKWARPVSVHNRTVLYKESIDTQRGPIRM